MKKIFAVILSLLIFTGCSGNPTKTQPVTKGIAFSCEIKYYNEHYECECEVHNNGEMLIKFCYPTEIEGLKFTLSKNGVSAEYKGTQYINNNSFFEKTAAYLIYEALSEADSEVLTDDDVFYINGENDDFDYRLELGASGLPIRLITNPDIIEVVFKNVTIK